MEVPAKYDIDKMRKFLQERSFLCRSCHRCFTPDLLQDVPGRRIRVEMKHFYPARGIPTEWSPIVVALALFAECPSCGKETQELTAT